MFDPGIWLQNWLRKRYEHGEHVPSPHYILTDVAIQALRDYEAERNDSSSETKNK